MVLAADEIEMDFQTRRLFINYCIETIEVVKSVAKEKVVLFDENVMFVLVVSHWPFAGSLEGCSSDDRVVAIDG